MVSERERRQTGSLETRAHPGGPERGLVPSHECFFSLHRFQALSYCNGHGGLRLGRKPFSCVGRIIPDTIGTISLLFTNTLLYIYLSLSVPPSSHFSFSRLELSGNASFLPCPTLPLQRSPSCLFLFLCLKINYSSARMLN